MQYQAKQYEAEQCEAKQYDARPYDARPYDARPYDESRRPTAGRAYQAALARGLIGSLGVDEAVRCARRHRWDGVLTLVLAEAGGAGVCAASG